MKINLLDIGEDGHEFTFKWHDEKSIDEKVESVVEGLKGFQFRIFLQKAGDIYTAQGDYTLEQEQECSLCAEDLFQPVKNRFTDYLMNKGKADQKGHTPHNGLNIDSEKEVTFVQHHELDLAKFIAEAFALAIAPYPKCADVPSCEQRQKENKKYYQDPKEKGHPAFSVLSKLKKDTR